MIALVDVKRRLVSCDPAWSLAIRRASMKSLNSESFAAFLCCTPFAVEKKNCR
jgi:hypothetical protein